MANLTCRICGTSVEQADNFLATGMYGCPRCGLVKVSQESIAAFDYLRGEGQFDPIKHPAKADALSHAVRCMAGSSGNYVYLRPDDIMTLMHTAHINSPAEQADNLLLWLGSRPEAIDDPSVFIVFEVGTLASIIGSRSRTPALDYILAYAADRGWIERSTQYSGKPLKGHARLTVAGWTRFDELQRAQADGRRAFMAMQFNDPSVTAAYENCFKPAAADAGFDLRLVTDGQQAGLIDDHIRVAIRTARFLIADLTTNNRGAYWEAGFAEGLGRKVIYVCREDTFKNPDPALRPHFDTSHLNTVEWSADKLDVARQRLADTIRNTFPDEAKLT